jgi:hypothetical protein
MTTDRGSILDNIVDTDDACEYFQKNIALPCDKLRQLLALGSACGVFYGIGLMDRASEFQSRVSPSVDINLNTPRIRL